VGSQRPLKSFRTQAGQSEPSVYAHYLYDAGGQRLKKLVRKQAGQIELTVYIDGIFEYQRIVKGGTVQENNTLHVMDNQSRIALVRVGDAFSDDTTPPVKYHLGDHLGSSNLTMDDAGNWINREEYAPYGETSFGVLRGSGIVLRGRSAMRKVGCIITEHDISLRG